MEASNIKNLVFDLGGVILDLSVNHTLEKFASLAGISGAEALERFHSSPGFNEYEKGGMSDAEFRRYLREVYQLQDINGVLVSDQDIDACWNAMLLGIPAVKLELLLKLKTKYNVFLLSNTNDIHLNYINTVILPGVSGDTSLDRYFHKAYYSHRMLKRKPDAGIYEQVLEENGLAASQTLFLDDNAMNIEGAKSVGIRTVHVTSPDLILEYFHA